MQETGFEHLHQHSIYSILDGYATVEEYAARSVKIGQHYLAITDHGMMAAVPNQIRNCDETTNKGHTLHPIFGIELYLNDKHCSAEERKHLSPKELKEQRTSYHLLAIAHNITGYYNLIKLSSWGWCHGFYYKARVTYEQILKHKEGIIFTSCCYLGEIGQQFDKNGPDAAEEMLKKYMAMFGENFYLELMLLDFSKQKPYDAWLIQMHDKYHIPIIITQDAHYANPEDSKYQRYMLMAKKKTTIIDLNKKLEGEDGQEIFELQDANLWRKSEKELNDKWESDYKDIIPLDLFNQAKSNTVKICERARGVKIDREPKLPQIPNEKEKFAEAVFQGMKWRGLLGKKEYRKRVEEEMELIQRKGFCSYFLIQQIFCTEARRKCKEMLNWGDGSDAVGCGRGSAVGSLVTYVLGITNVDPLKHDLLFSRFLSEARGGKMLKTKFSEK